MNRLSSFHHENHPNFDLKGFNELREAVRSRDKDSVRNLLEKDTPVNGILGAGDTNFAYLTPLHLAVISRHPDIVKSLVDKGADVNAGSWHGETPLMMAAKMQDMKLTDVLLTHEVEDWANGDGFRHLHVACMRNRLDIVKKMIMINQGSNVNSSVSKSSLHWSGYTALHFAVHFESIEVVEFLLSCGASITLVDSRQLTPLHLADFVRNEKIIDMILAAHKFEFTNPIDIHGYSHFHIACTRDNVSIVEHFLESGVNIDCEVRSSRWEGWKSVHFAIYYECPNVIKLLLENQALLRAECLPKLLIGAFWLSDKTMQNSTLVNKFKYSERCKTIEKLTPLHLACIENHEEEVKNLLSDEANSTIVNSDAPIWTGCEPLHLAVKYASNKVVRLLLNHGTDIMLQNAEGKTPLHIAFERRGDITLDNIIEKAVGLDQNLTDNTGVSVFHILCTTDRLDLIENFIKSGVDINAQVGSESALWSGFTAIHFACRFLRRNVVDLLLKSDVNLFIKNGSNMDPFNLIVYELHFSKHTAIYQYSFEILMKILLRSREKFNNFDKKNITCLHTLCASRSINEEMLEQYLITNKHEIDSRIELPGSSVFDKCTPLHLALRFENFELADVLIQNGADPYVLNAVWDTPMEYAFTRDFLYAAFSSDDSHRKVQNLFDSKISSNNLKPGPFYIACVLGLADVVKNVLDNISDEKMKMKFLNCRNDAGQTFLHSLMLEGMLEGDGEVLIKQILCMLLENGADVNAQDPELQTPLHVLLKSKSEVKVQAASKQRKDVKIMRILLQHGADANVKNIYGETSLHKIYLTYRNINVRAHHNSSGELSDSVNYDLCNDKLTLALQYGADINVVDDFGRTCLSMIGDDLYHELRTDTFLKDCVVTLRKHINKLQVMGLTISEINLKALEDFDYYCEEDSEEVAFIDKCEKELELLRSSRVDRYSTLSDILYKSSHEMVSHCESQTLLEMVQSDDMVNKYPIYGHLLRVQMKKGQFRRRLLEKCESSITYVIGLLLPNECLDRILRHLSDEDLRHIISSSGKIFEY